MNAGNAGVVWIGGELGLGQLQKSPDPTASYQFTGFPLNLAGFRVLPREFAGVVGTQINASQPPDLCSWITAAGQGRALPP